MRSHPANRVHGGRHRDGAGLRRGQSRRTELGEAWPSAPSTAVPRTTATTTRIPKPSRRTSSPAWVVGCTGRDFAGRRETDVERLVATSEAHDGGLCAADAGTKRRFAPDLLNLAPEPVKGSSVSQRPLRRLWQERETPRQSCIPDEQNDAPHQPEKAWLLLGTARDGTDTVGRDERAGSDVNGPLKPTLRCVRTCDGTGAGDGRKLWWASSTGRRRACTGWRVWEVTTSKAWRRSAARRRRSGRAIRRSRPATAASWTTRTARKEREASRGSWADER